MDLPSILDKLVGLNLDIGNTNNINLVFKSTRKLSAPE
tara:strand:+ start:96 stop:209 length:114 start_codon:yes stop_codon:yes gene_type:complete